MLRLALCDDEQTQRTAIGELLLEYTERKREAAVHVSVFSSARTLLAAVEEHGDFDIYLLDVVMPQMSGIELGIALRALGSTGAIVYLTISPEYAVDSYAARAFYYLIKPPDPAQLFQVLDQAAVELEKRKVACITVKAKSGLRLVRMDEILYAELVDRAICYHLFGGRRVESVTVRGSFQEEVAPLLADGRFFLCGASFVVNLFYVTTVERGALRLDGEYRVPLARSFAAQAKKRWQEFWLNMLEREI